MDRFVEIDCDVFGPPFSDEKIRETLSSLSPLVAEAMSDEKLVRGVVINFGWLMDIVTMWSGDVAQKLPIDSHRLADWGNLSYSDLAGFIQRFRQQAVELGLEDLKVGPMMLGIGEFRTEIVKPPHESTEEEQQGAIYQEKSAWFERHPEVFPFPIALALHGPGIDFRQPLAADTSQYAAFPHGIPEGTTFADFFSSQWAHLSHTVGFDLLHLRDEFTSPIHSGRVSFDGDGTPASVEEIEEWTTHLIDVINSIKHKSPETFLIIYSTGLSPAVERAYARIDIGRVASESAVDAWIEQTWGGAWQDWWDAGLQGWTFQYTHLVSRLSQIALANRTRGDNPCRHYRLIQLLDGWEPYDTFHDYREKLRWGIWAFGHAAVELPHGKGLHRTAGCYFAFANNSRAELLSDNEIDWIANEVAVAESSAREMTGVRGFSIEVGALPGVPGAAPILWMEEIAGFLMKFGVPIASGHDSQEPVSSLPRIDSTSTVSPETATAVIGGADRLPLEMHKHLGLSSKGASVPPGYTITHSSESDLRPTFWPYYPQHVRVSGTNKRFLWSEDSALADKLGNTLWWLPPDIANPKDRRLPHYQIGAIEPHVLLARKLLEHPTASAMTRIDPLPVHQPVSVVSWDSESCHHVLLGNLESGWIGDSRYARVVALRLPDIPGRVFSSEALTDQRVVLSVSHQRIKVAVPPEGMVLLSIGFTDGE